MAHHSGVELFQKRLDCIVELLNRVKHSFSKARQNPTLSNQYIGFDFCFMLEMSDFYTLAADSFAVLADWYHFAILELTFVNGFKSDPRWIARELDVSVQEVKGAIDRLLRLGLLEMNGGKLMKTHESVSNHVGLKSTSAHKTLQKQVLSKALSAIDETGAEDKDITSITMAIDPKNIELAREAIKNFRRELCATLENGNQTRVYNLAIQLYPISKGNS